MNKGLQLFRRARWPKPPTQKVCATLGSFDGLHRGHECIIRRVIEVAKDTNAEPLVVSFYPHPATVVGRASQIPKLMTLRQTCTRLSTLGIRNFCLIHFTQSVASLSAETFLVEMLIKSLGIETLVIGGDARVGKGGAGTAPIIQEIMQRHGARAIIQEFEQTQGTKVGSREIRQYISEGKIEAANLLLGRPFALEGTIQHGAGRGSTIGIPTANINSTKQILPQKGVYATQTLLRGVLWPSITNIGIRPTFGGSQTVVESHLLGYSGGDFYNSRVEVSFLSKIREERKFGSPAELVAQIRVDIEAARAFHAAI